MFYKVTVLGFPLFSEETKSMWNIEAKITFKGKNKNVFVSMALPTEQDGVVIVNEESSSQNYGYITSNEDNIKRGEWSKRVVTGEQILYYSIDILKDEFYKAKIDDKEETLYPLQISKANKQAAKALLDEVYVKSSNSISFASLLLQEINSKEPSQLVTMLKNNFMKTSRQKRDVLLRMIKYMDYNVRTVDIILLEDGRKNIALTPMFEVKYNEEWKLFDIDTGRVANAKDIFIWQRGSLSLLDAEGVKQSKVRFSISENIIPARVAALSKNVENENALLDFSLFVLPNASQNTFKLLLLVPLGALVVVIIRVLVGLKTSGTFMPILLAMAFMQTELIPGILMFILVVSMGLIVRSYLSHLNLLLVSRISAVVIVVVGIMAFVAILAQKLDLEYATSITFFPMIILAWTIERMSIIWEEDGPKEVFQQGGGSLIVAVLAYFTMMNETLGFITFNFPEVLLAVLGVIILLGRYSGYRISELYRFKSMVN
jgi:hypothetical protein